MKKSLNILIACAAVIAVNLSGVRPATALPLLGDLDTSFNAAGVKPGTIITTASYYHDHAFAVVVQADGKIVVAGDSMIGLGGTDIALVRYAADGSRDTGFDGDGIVTTDFGSASERAAGLVVQPDGKLVVIIDGFSNGADSDFALARYNTDGSLDSAFGSSGVATTDFGSTNDYVGGIALQTDGKLVVSGYINLGGGVFNYVLARYNSDGSLDSTFGTDGKVTTALGTNNDWDVTVTLQPDGKIVIGSAYSSGGADFFLARYTLDGLLDTTFNPGSSLAPGTVTVDVGDTFEAVKALLVQPDGKIVAAGRSGSNIAIARFNVDGSLDSAFGTGGKAVYAGGSSSSEADAIALQPNGKLVVAGPASNGVDRDFTLVRFTANGTVEGARVDPIGSSSDSVYAVALQPDGKIVAAGYAQKGSYNDIALARYVSNDVPWDLTPDAFSFTDANGVGQGSVQTSDMITIAGLDGNVSVPVTVSGGEYAKNGATTYTSDPGWVRNGDTVNVRQTASSSGGQTTDTVLTVGGIMPGNDLAQVLGTTVSDTFSVTTDSGGGSGSGLFGPWSIALLILEWRRRGRKGRDLT